MESKQEANPGATPVENAEILSDSLKTVGNILCSNITRPAQRMSTTSAPPTGGIALLIEILAREALKDVMAKRSKGCRPRNLR